MSDKRKIIQPDEVFEAPGFTHGVKTKGTETLYIAGQLPWDKDFQLVGENDLKKQSKQAMKNIQAVLEEAGGDWTNLVQLTTYTTKPNKSEEINEVKTKLYDGIASPADTLIGVDALADPGAFIEIQAIAVL